MICSNCGRSYPDDIGRVVCGCKSRVGNRWVRLVRMLRKPEDKGVGDTVQRIAAKFGGERFKAWAERIGIPCGCVARQEEWNRVWPY